MESPASPDGHDLVVGSLAELGLPRAYAWLALRVDVFVVEQSCAYPELDGRDLEPGTRHWVLVDRSTDRVVAGLRSLAERDATGAVVRVGRVATHVDHRGHGHARLLLDAVVDEAGDPIVLDAQDHLQPWYETSGFHRTGPGWVEDGIPHVPMRRDPST